MFMILICSNCNVYFLLNIVLLLRYFLHHFLFLFSDSLSLLAEILKLPFPFKKLKMIYKCYKQSVFTVIATKNPVSKNKNVLPGRSGATKVWSTAHCHK